MKGSVRNQILYYLYSSGDTDRILFERFHLPIDIYFKVLKSIKKQGLIDFDSGKVPNSSLSHFIYPDHIDIEIKLTDLGAKYVKRKLITPKENVDFIPDKLDSFQYDTVGVNLPSFENMSYSEFLEKHMDLPRNIKMDKRIFYYILTGNFIEKASIKEQPIIKETLKWLHPFSKAYESFDTALTQYQNNELSRSLLDNLRFSLEQFLKQFLSNEAPLEKQSKRIKEYLNEHNINPEIRDIYKDVFQRFYLYQNANVKHNDNYSEIEIEFVIEITSSLMRLLLKTKHNTGSNAILA